MKGYFGPKPSGLKCAVLGFGIFGVALKVSGFRVPRVPVKGYRKGTIRV